MVREKPRLEAYCARYSGMPFFWGYHDCFLFCLRWMDLQRGEHVKKEYDYSTELEALKVLARHRAKVAPDLFDKHYRRTSKPKVGDLIEYRTEHKLGGCAIYGGNGISYTINNSGQIDTVRGYLRAWGR